MRLLMTLPPFPIARLSEELSFIKFILPLEQDAAHLPRSLGAIDTICHLGCLAHEIVAVDDASSDGTAAEARRYAHFMPLWLIQHGRSMGRAIAFRTALEAACRDVSEGDLILPIDPLRSIDPQAALRAIAAAQAGCEAVLVPAPHAERSRNEEPELQDVTVYHAALVKQHLAGFLETPPSENAAAVGQLERYLMSAGVLFRRLPQPPLELRVGRSPAQTVRALLATAGRTH
jgi:glycosyltransferase involved in cell wall biosynthesis